MTISIKIFEKTYLITQLTPQDTFEGYFGDSTSTVLPMSAVLMVTPQLFRVKIFENHDIFMVSYVSLKKMNIQLMICFRNARVETSFKASLLD